MADYPILPWLAPVSPVAPFLQGVSQGAGIAEAQNRQALAVAQLQEQEQQNAFRAAQAAIQMQMQQEAAQREQAVQGQQLFGLRLANQQKASEMAATMQQQGAFQRLVGAGVPPDEAFKQSAGMAPFAQAARYYQMQALQQGIQNRQDRARTANAGLPPGTSPEDVAAKIAILKLPASVRAGLSRAEAVISANPDITPEKKTEILTRYTQDPSSYNAPKDQIDLANAAADGASALSQVRQHIEQFNQKFGPGAFDKFTGPIDDRIQKFKNLTGFTADDERFVRQISSELEGSIQEYRKKLFGSALTGNEEKRWQTFIDDKNKAGVLESIKAANGALDDKVLRVIEKYPYAPNIPPPIYDRYAGRKQGDWFMPGAQQPQQNLVPRKTSDGKTALFDPATKKFVRYAE